jgi:hypothetical protein
MLCVWQPVVHAGAVGKANLEAGKAPRDERIEALVKARDAAIQKQKLAETEKERFRVQAESAAALHNQVEALRATVASLERQQFESRQFEQVCCCCFSLPCPLALSLMWD